LIKGMHEWMGSYIHVMKGKFSSNKLKVFLFWGVFN